VAGGEQAGNEPDQVPRDVEHDTISGHAEPSGQGGYFGETSSTGGSASFPVMSAYVRASSRTPCYRPSVGFPATEKTSLAEDRCGKRLREDYLKVFSLIAAPA
jgi:hypothetical protein